jgi:hypothetical protein
MRCWGIGALRGGVALRRRSGEGNGEVRTPASLGADRFGRWARVWSVVDRPHRARSRAVA